MHRRSSVVTAGLLAAAVVLAVGCGSTTGALSPRGAEPALSLEAAPVADLSCAEFGLPRVFMGLGYAYVFPWDSTLASGSVYDLNAAYDIATFLTAELAVGLWNIGDRPENVPGADSTFQMRPALLMIQLAREIPGARLYVGAGGGYSQNSYDLGTNHETYMENYEKLVDYSVRADDAWMMQYAVGADVYSTADADLNLGIELRFVTGAVERSDFIADEARLTDVVDLDLYLFRLNLTWHF